jgi:HTH-type transcriptional regulator/antitoxin HigA
VAERRL